MAKPTSNPSVNLDQWADGPVSQGDVDGSGQTQEVFVNGNLNAQKAHYNEGDAIPYRAIVDNLDTGVVYGLVIQWDTVDSGAYALDYLVGYNFSFEGTRHPGEPDVTPTVGVGDLSSGLISTAVIPSDPVLLDGFGAQFGVTDGLNSGQPSGAQSITIFGAVSDVSVSGVTYNADKTKASVTIIFTYTGATADNADSVVVAWGGHIASSLDWADDPGETVETASDISGSPYHMRVLSLVIDGTETSIGNQDRSLSADAVAPPPPDAGNASVIGDDDDTPDGIGDAAPGDDIASVAAFTPVPVTDATSVDFASLHLDPVLDTSSAAVKSGGVALFYFWDATNLTLYASTNVSTVTTAAATAVFSIQLQEGAPGLFDYLFTLLDQVDHPPGNNENDVLVDVTFTATGAGGTDTGTISIKLDDDLPVRAANPTPVTATVEEDGMSSATTPESGGLDGNDQSEGNRASSGDGLTDDQASGSTGSLAALVDVGADEPGTFSLSDVTSSLPTLFSKGVAVTYAVTDSADPDTIKDTLTASAGGRTVFTLKVNPDGSWAFDLDDQLDHVAGNGENTALRTAADGSTSVPSIDFSSLVQVTDFDGDTTAPLLAGDFAITVEDDIPTRAANPQAVTATVEEDGMSSAVTPEAGGLNGNDQSLGNPGAGDTLTDDQASGAIGSLTALMSVGADEPPTISLSSVTTSLPTLFSKGDAVSYTVTDSGDADTLLDTLTATAGGRTVFTLKVNPDGSWAFDLDDQLDHVDDVGNGENTLLRTNAAGTTSVASIDFSSIVQVTDADGDTVAPLQAGDFAITVEDDIPTRAANPQSVTATVEEDGMSSAVTPEAGGLNGNDQSLGNPGAGDTLTDDQASGAIGSLTALMSVGADEPPTISLSNVTTGLPALFSKGDAVSYAVTDSGDADTLLDTLTATAGGRTIFTLKVNPDGSWAFDLDDQLDHVDDVGNAENTALRTTADGSTSVASIDFSSIVQVTDFDGDTVAPLLAGDFAITVEDDIPVRAASPTPVTATVEEDGMSSDVTPEAGGLNGNDQSLGNPGAGDTLSDDQASGAVGSLATLVSVGADEPPTFSLSDVTSSLPTLFSKGEAVTYSVTDSADPDTVKDTLTATAGGRTVFTLKVNPDGSWAFDLDDQLDHVDDVGNAENTALRTNLAGTTSVAAIDFSSVVQVTDFDGDTVGPLLAGDFAITVEDDIPTRAANPQAVTATVEEDGMSSAVTPEAGGLNGNDQSKGNPGAGDTLSDDQASGLIGSLTALMSVGADEPPTISLGSVTTSLPTLFSKGQAVTYAVTDSADPDTLLDTLTATAGGRTIFTLKVNPDGSWSFDLDDQLDHVDDGANTENTALRTNAGGTTSVASIDFSAIVQVTDADGDTVAPLLSGDFAITVEDDIPLATSITNVVGFNTGDPLTGKYNLSVGADEPGEFVLLTLTGTTPSNRAIFNVQLNQVSDFVTNFSFDYFLKEAPATGTASATGTVTFNADGTYVVDLNGPILGSTTFSTSGGTSLNYDTLGNNSPEITVKQYTSTFFGVLTGQAADPPSDTDDLKTDDNDFSFAAGDTFKSVGTAFVNVATDTVGVNSDTVQNGELLNYDFFTANPVAGPTSPPQRPTASVDASTPKGFVDTVDITLNQINVGKEDVAILLKLYNASTDTFTTRLLLANAASDYQPIAGSTDVLVSVTEADYPAGYRIYGMQILTSTENLTGTGFSLSTGAVVNLTSAGSDLEDTSDPDVMKIIKIEVTANIPGDADLAFTGKLTDEDGDDSPGFNFGVHLEGNSNVLAGGTGSDYLNGTAAADTMSGGAGADFMAGGGGADVFQFASGDSGITLAAADTIVDFLTAVDKIATSKAAGNATIANGGALADFAAFIAAADAVLTAGAGTNDIYAAYNAAGSGDAWAVVDENDSGSVDAGDTLIVLTGINVAGEIAAADFI